MARSLETQVRDLNRFVEDFLSGAFPQRSPLGPGAISKSFIRAKSITGSMIDVSNLQAVSTQTGTLNVDGDITITSGGAIKEGLTGFTDAVNSGFWLGDDAGTPKFKIGSPTKYLKWDGATFSVKGDVQADTGTIGGFVIGATDFATSDNAEGMASSGSVRLWIGNATPSSAPFRVSSLGVLTAAGATLEGALTATTGTLITLSVTGVLTLSGSGTLRFNGSSNQITTAGIITNSIDANGGTLANLTVDGQLDVGAAIVVATTGGVVRSGATSYTAGTGWILEYNAGTPRFRVGTATSGTNYLAFDGTNIEMRGKLKWGSGGVNYIDSNIIHIEATGGSVTKGLEWGLDGTTGPSFHIGGTVDSASPTSSTGQIYAAGTSASFYSYGEFKGGNGTIKSSLRLLIREGAVQFHSINMGNDYGIQLQNLFTGTGVNAKILMDLGGSAGNEQFQVRDSAGQVQFGVSSNGTFSSPDADTNTGSASAPTLGGNHTGRIPWFVNGVQKYIHYHDA
jgi:hypothetical protein